MKPHAAREVTDTLEWDREERVKNQESRKKNQESRTKSQERSCGGEWQSGILRRI